MSDRIRAVSFSVVLACLAGCGGGAAAPSLHDAFDAKRAFGYTSQVVSFGERWPGSDGHKKTEALIREVLTRDGASIEIDDFVADTPRGPVPVHNIIGKFSATKDRAQPIFILA